MTRPNELTGKPTGVSIFESEVDAWMSSVPIDADCVAPAERAAAIVLHRHERTVTMEACIVSSRQQAATAACSVLPLLGIVG